MLKQLILSGLYLGGAFYIGEMLLRHRLAVLTYHRVIPREHGKSSTRPPNTLFVDEFDSQMAYVARRFYVPGQKELQEFLAGKGRLPRYSVAVSFDDGYENNFIHALPVLQHHRLHAMFFVTSGLIGTEKRMFWFDRLDRLLSAVPVKRILEQLRRLDATAPDESGVAMQRWFKKLPHSRQAELLDALEREFEKLPFPPTDRTVHGLMSWDQVRVLAAAGMTVGSHSRNHQILAAVSPDEAHEEMLTSRQEIERQTSQPCWCFAYPNGERHDFRDVDEQSAASAGYTCAFTQIPGTVRESSPRYALPRIPIPDTGDIRVFRSYLSGVQRALRKIVPRRA